MLFGIEEMKQFASSHEDPRVVSIWNRLNEARRKNALWSDKVAQLEAMLAEAKRDEYTESVVIYMNIVKHMWANSSLSNFGYDSMTDEMKRAFNRVVGKPIGDRNI